MSQNNTIFSPSLSGEQTTGESEDAPFYKRADILRLTNVSKATWNRWIREGKAPPPATGWPGREPRWPRDVVDAWLAAIR